MLWAVFAGLFALAAVACSWAAVRVVSFYDSEVRVPLVVFLGLTAAWGLTNSLLVVPQAPVELMHGAYLVGLVAGIGTVPVWLWFCSAYAGHPYHYDRRLQALSVGLTAGVVLLKLTNPLHGWYFGPQVATEPFVHFAPETGVVYWTVAALSYVAAAVGLYLLFELYFDSRFRTRKVAVLTGLIALPVVPKLVAVVRPDTLALLFYEPLGAAVFAVGIVTVFRDSFLSVRAPARRQLADSLQDLVIVLDRDDRIADYNDGAAQLFEGLEGMVGQPLSAGLPELAAQLDSDKPVALSTGASGRYYVVRTTPVRLGKRTVGRGILLSDVTELEAQRRRLRQQAEHREGLTEGIAHELRNPLTIIQGQLQLVKRQHHDDETDGRIETALGATERMAGIVDDLIAIVAYGKPVTETEPLGLAELLDRAWRMAGGEGTLTVTVPEGAQLTGERARATELFRLVFRAHQQRGSTTVRVERTDAGLAISGDGAGFDTDDPELLFRYGVETGEAVRMVLANARTLAQVHGWSIRADTDADGPRLVIEGPGVLD